MRYLSRRPSRHPAAWLALAAGLLALVYWSLARGETGVVGLLAGGALAALGLAELLPASLRGLSVAMRLAGLALAAAAIVAAGASLVF